MHVEWNWGGWTLDISEGWDMRSVDVAIKVALSPNVYNTHEEATNGGFIIIEAKLKDGFVNLV
jgi:hypothetical protein